MEFMPCNTDELKEAEPRQVRDWCSYDLGGFVGTIAEHAARQGISVNTVRGRKARGWSWSEALGYKQRENVGAGRGWTPSRDAIEERYGKPFDKVLADMQRQGMSKARTAELIGYDVRCLFRYLEKHPEKNPWRGVLRVSARFEAEHGETVEAWARKNSRRFTVTQAARFIGYAHPAGLSEYLETRGVKVEFAKHGKHKTFRGELDNITGHAQRHGVTPGTVLSRLSRGKTLVQALTDPVARRKRK